MMKIKINRYYLLVSIIFFYLIPMLFFSHYSIRLMSSNKSWGILTSGLLLCIGGSFLFFILLSCWEKSFKQGIQEAPLQKKVPTADIYSITHQSIEEEKQRTENLQKSLIAAQEDIQQKIQEMQKMQEEHDRLQKQALKSSQDFSEYKLFSEEQLNQKGLLIQSLQQRIHQQHDELEAKQEKISQFESKIRDLSYEIKTVLQLNESEIKEPEKSRKNTYTAKHDGFAVKEALHDYHVGDNISTATETQVQNDAEGSLLLKRCIDIAQKLAGVNYYGSEGMRHRELSPHNYAIDLRRLFDSLRSESGALVLVYSQKEDKLLFVNNQSKDLLGWSPEKFVQDFQSIVQKGTVDWKNALTQVTTHYEAHTQILMKTKTGSELAVRCRLGMIPVGLFKGYVIGILYPSI